MTVNVTKNFVMPAELWLELHAASQRTGESMSQIVCAAVQAWLAERAGGAK